MTKQLPYRFSSLPKLPLALLVMLAAATFWLNKVVQPPTTVEDSGSRRDPDYILEGLSITRMDHDGMARYTLFAKKLLHYPGNDSTPPVLGISQEQSAASIPATVQPQAATVRLKMTPWFNAQAATVQPQATTVQPQANPEKLPMQIKADQAELYGSNDDIYLSGNVTLLRGASNDSSKKTTIVTSFLHVIPDDDIVKTDKPVTITEGNTTINAVGMELDNHTRITRLLSQVRVAHDKKR